MEGSNARIQTHLDLSEVTQKGHVHPHMCSENFTEEVIMKDEQESEG